MSIREQISKIIFKNKPDKTTPLSAGNLNQLQYNIENALKVKLDYCNAMISNANNVTDAGIYQITNTATNLPFDPEATQHDGNICWLIVFLVDNMDPIIQIAIDSKTLELWIRKSQPYEVGWEEWKLLNYENEKIITGEEVKTNLVVDGKTVFCKRINGGNLPNTNAISLNTEISGEITAYKIEGMAFNPETNNQLPIPFVRPSSAISVYYAKEENVIYVRTESDRTSYTYYIDFYYTYDD